DHGFARVRFEERKYFQSAFCFSFGKNFFSAGNEREPFRFGCFFSLEAFWRYRRSHDREISHPEQKNYHRANQLKRPLHSNLRDFARVDSLASRHIALVRRIQDGLVKSAGNRKGKTLPSSASK